MSLIPIAEETLRRWAEALDFSAIEGDYLAMEAAGDYVREEILAVLWGDQMNMKIHMETLKEWVKLAEKINDGLYKGGLHPLVKELLRKMQAVVPAFKED
ncbi:MAG: hypothetical protein LBT40_15890 [Deltaproteobacteria bacterium]|jgi:hypothetical protein|nr:hypothetical protein [Deltaproteobacteria bacterium]